MFICEWNDDDEMMILIVDDIMENLLIYMGVNHKNVYKNGTLPAVGKYFVIGPLCNAGKDCPWNKFNFCTKVFSSSRED